MELKDKLMGCVLLQINKDNAKARLKFFDRNSNRNFTLSFDGLLFETSYLILNKRVIRAELTHTLGFKAISQLNFLGKNPNGYKQLFIQLDANNGEFKNELICALKEYTIRYA